LDKNSIEGGDIMNELKQTHNDILASLVDIRDVKIDRKLPVEDRIKSYVEQVKNPYLFKVGETVVRVSYANTQATINDNFINMIASM
jgi:methionine synthase II (cobalamin-independent)